MSEVRSPGRATLAGRLLTVYAVVFILLIGLFGVLTLNAVESVLRRQAVESLARQARSVQIDLDRFEVGDLDEAVAERAAVLEARLTVIALDGTVLADSASDPAGMENHADRPEVAVALAGGVGADSRVSDTTDELQSYVAVPAVGDRIYRLSVREVQLAARIAEVGTLVGLAALVAGVVGVVLMALIARWVARPIEDLTGVAREIADGRLDVRARRSPIRELDRLGSSIGQMAQELGKRVRDSEAERETLQALLDALPQGVILIGPDESILYGNGMAREIIGTIPDRLSMLAPHPLQRLAREAMEDGEAGDVLLESTGAGPTLRALATPLPDDRVMVVIADITERIRIERMRRDFVADASHELKTPIASILAASETLQMALEHDLDRAQRFVTLVQESAAQLARIVGDLLDLSRVESSPGGGTAVAFDRVIVDEVERLRPRAEEKNIEIEVEVEAATVIGSPSDLALAVGNLVSNAIRYSSPEDRVTVGLVREVDSVRLFVTDTGVGIPKRSINRVFERFYRVDVARSRETGGTGLGLAIVKHVAETHGGSVAVESELAVGSTFHLVLPLAPTTDTSAD
jgi:two-component system phosphate regulon sensor histidine kinase PhoR